MHMNDRYTLHGLLQLHALHASTMTKSAAAIQLLGLLVIIVSILSQYRLQFDFLPKA